MISKDKVRIAISIDRSLLKILKLTLDPNDKRTYSELFTFLMYYFYDRETK